MAITYNDVAEAAKQMLREDKTPSINGVLAILGRGSATTVSKHLKRFRAQWAESMETPELEDAPQGLAQMMTEIWQHARKHALDRLEVERKTAKENVEKAQARADDAVNEFNRVRADLERKQAVNEKLRDEVQQLKQDKAARDTALQDKETALSKAKDRLHHERTQRDNDRGHFEAVIAEHKTATARLEEEMASRLTEQREAYEKRLQDEKARFETQDRHWLKQLEDARQQARRTIEKVEKEKREADERASRLNGELIKAREAEKTAQAREAELTIQIRKESKRADDVLALLKEKSQEEKSLREKLDKANTEKSDWVRQHERDKVALTEMQARCRELEKRLKEREG